MLAAIVVLYFPEQQNLQRLLQLLLPQVSKILIVDNTPEKQLDWLNAGWFSFQDLTLEYIALGGNKGIAKAQNIGLKAAIHAGFKKFILFDQDSEPSEDMVIQLIAAEKYLHENGVKIAAIGPLIYEKKKKSYNDAIIYKYFFAKKIPVCPEINEPIRSDAIIASGKMISIEAINAIGMMMDELFIDLVDTEWCIRAKSKGYFSYMSPKSILNHSIGDCCIKLMGFDVMKHSNLRKYYQIRNRCFLLTVRYMGVEWRTCSVISLLKMSVVSLIISNEKINMFKFMIKACLDGFQAKLGVKR